MAKVLNKTGKKYSHGTFRFRRKSNSPKTKKEKSAQGIKD